MLLLDRNNDNNSFVDIENQRSDSKELNKNPSPEIPKNIENLDDDIPFKKFN